MSPEVVPQIKSKGNARLLEEPLTALFCSQRCPGDLILKTYDLARAMRDAGLPVIGGFQTPMEKECLRLLLRGEQPVVVCPARGIDNMRIPRDWRPALDEDRLLVLSPFPSTRRRPTAGLAAQRNDLVAELAAQVFIAHAAPGSKTEAFARKLAASGKPLLTLNSPANANLVEMGALVVAQEGFGRRLVKTVSEVVRREVRSGDLGMNQAPQVGFEPTTRRLTADCSTAELLRSVDGLEAPDLQTILASG